MRFRPRFTLRTLAIVVTLVAAYFGAWETTKRYGGRLGPTTRFGLDENGKEYSWQERILGSTSPMPFVVRRDEFWAPPEPMLSISTSLYRRYYLWFFGAEMELPIEAQEIPFPILENT